MSLPANFTAVVTRVIDGDPYLVRTDENVGAELVIIRIAGIDCFEARKTQKCRAQAARAGITPEAAKERGLQAYYFAELQLTGQEIECRAAEGFPDRDDWGRTVREVWLADVNVATLLRAAGYEAG